MHTWPAHGWLVLNRLELLPLHRPTTAAQAIAWWTRLGCSRAGCTSCRAPASYRCRGVTTTTTPLPTQADTILNWLGYRLHASREGLACLVEAETVRLVSVSWTRLTLTNAAHTCCDRPLQMRLEGEQLNRLQPKVCW